MRLKGKTALVTGGASGFGAEIARAHVREGAKVVILDLNKDGSEAVAKDAGGGTVAVAGDVTKRADIEAAVVRAVAAFGSLDIVVNNAGWTFFINVKSNLPGDQRCRSGVSQAGKRQYHQYRLDGRRSSASRPDLGTTAPKMR